MYTVKTFFGLSLRSASVIIGWLNAVISLSQTIICIVIVACLDEIMFLVAYIFGKHFLEVELTPVICLLVSLKLGVSISDLVASILVNVGTHKNSQLMLLPWLINNFVGLILFVPFHFILFAAVFNSGIISLVYLLFLFFIWGLNFYIWTAVYSLFKEICKSKDRLVDSDHKHLNNYELFNKSQCDMNGKLY